LKVIHFTNEQVMFHIETTLKEIESAIQIRLKNVCN
jgi:very-short-patch-repair endonuclease